MSGTVQDTCDACHCHILNSKYPFQKFDHEHTQWNGNLWIQPNDTYYQLHVQWWCHFVIHLSKITTWEQWEGEHDLQAVNGDDSIARSLLPLLEEVEKSQHGGFAGGDGWGRRPRHELEMANSLWCFSLQKSRLQIRLIQILTHRVKRGDEATTTDYRYWIRLLCKDYTVYKIHTELNCNASQG